MRVAVLLLLAGCDFVFFSGVDEPVPPRPDEWRLVSAGSNHSCAIRHDDSLWCWGAGVSGQLGDDSGRDAIAPTRVAGKWESVFAGHRNTCGIQTDGSLWCWGANETGETGPGVPTMMFVLAPERVDDARWKRVSIAVTHACGIQRDDSLWCWGNDSLQQLGLGVGDQSGQPPARVTSGPWKEVVTGAIHTCAIAFDDTLWCWGANNQQQQGIGAQGDIVEAPRQVSADADWNNLTAGSEHTCALRKGAAYCWGLNTDGQLGDQSTTRRGVPNLVAGGPFVALSAGSFHTCGIDAAGIASCWGANQFGQLAIDDPTGRAFPDVKPIVSDRTFRMVAAGGGHTCALTMDNKIECAGSNARGELGDGTGGPRLVPSRVMDRVKKVASGGGHVCAVMDGDSELRCWGENSIGELADSSLLPRQLPQLATNRGGDVAVGANHTCQYSASTSQLFCWGSNVTGQIGRGGTSPAPSSASPFEVRVPAGSTLGPWTAVATGGEHTCGLHSSNYLECWGNNDAGQLGVGDRVRRNAPTQVMAELFTKVTAGGEHTCGLRASTGVVLCWGRGAAGQLGINGTGNRMVPTPTTPMPSLVATEVSAGGGHTCALKMSGELLCWGDNTVGQLGIGSLPNALEPVKLQQTWTTVSAGMNHTCAIRSTDSKLLCWGANNVGQLGDGSQVDRVHPVEVKSDETWQMVEAGDQSTCAVTTSGVLFCWGTHELGQLGDGSSWRSTLVQVAPAGS